MDKRLGVFGDKDIVGVFKALGFEILDKVDDLDDFSLVLVTQTEYKQHDFTKYDDRPYPIILAIPDGREKDGESINKIIRNMEKAVGSSAALRN
ncbi:MAG: hypothetical protein FWE31_03770 [Firmicutes bacterium]|nr:hypothetical protein [Bacillota bacterium]